MQIEYTTTPQIYRSEFPSRWVWAGWILPPVALIAAMVAQYLAPEATRTYLTQEPFGAMEMIGFLFPALTAIVGIRLLAYPAVRADWLVALVAACLVVGGIFVSGEEVSWGQWFMNWSTPELWAELNDQQETNLHNISPWLDQKPRLLLLLTVAVSGFMWPLIINLRPDLVWKRFDILYPPFWMLGLAVMILSTEMLSHVELPEVLSERIEKLRTGEIQEVYIYTYLLAYALTLWKRVAAIR